MSKIGKKHAAVKKKFADVAFNSWRDVFSFVIENKHTKFDESVDVGIVLGIDPTKGEQNVRGSALLPHGTGKTVKILAFVKGEHYDQAKKAGADYVGSDDLIEKIQEGWLDFDVAVATPDMMAPVGKVAKILGPKGLLPNKKVGTVTFDIEGIVSDLKKGRVSFRNDKSGNLHAPFGKVSFGVEKLLDNFRALVKAVQSSKPSSSKGKFLRKISVSSTMGVGVSFNADEVFDK